MSNNKGKELVIAKYKFEARKATELTFAQGDVIALASSGAEPAQGWLRGHLLKDEEDKVPDLKDKLFPSNYVDRPGVGKETFVLAVAVFDFTGRNDRELSLHAGDVVTLINPDYHSAYLTVQFHGHRGLVPTDYVELAEYCDDDANEEEKDPDDIPPPPSADATPPKKPDHPPTLRKLNVIKALRHGGSPSPAPTTTAATTTSPSSSPAPTIKEEAASRPVARSFRVSAPPARTGGKADSTVDIPPPPVPPPPVVKQPQSATAAKEDDSTRHKRLSMPPVASNSDLYTQLEAEAAAEKANQAAAPISVISVASFGPGTPQGNVANTVFVPKSEPLRIDPAVNAKIDAIINGKPASSVASADDDDDIPPPEPDVPPPCIEPQLSPRRGGRKNNRYSMLLPTDMAGLFEQKLKAEAAAAAAESSSGLSALGADVDASFDEPDSPDNIQYKSTGDLAGATFVKMLAYLTAPSAKTETQRLNNIKSFVECFRMYCTPEQFFEKVRMRFLSASNGSAIIQKNCIEMLLAWTQCAHSVDLASNHTLFENVQSFLDSVAKSSDTMSHAVCQSARHVQQMNRLLGQPVYLPEESILHPENYTQDPVPHASAFLKESAEDIAQQLSLIQRYMLMNICPVELVRDVWMADSADRLAPNLSAHVDFCNQKTLWLQEAVVCAKKDSERKKVISHIVDCAEQCLACNNFNGMMIFLSAVQSRSVKPLEKYFSSKAREKLEHTLLPLIANDCHELRSLQELRSPCIPYVDTWLADMAVLNRNTPDYLPGTRLINWNKIQVLGVSLRRLQNFQHSAEFTFGPRRPVIALIHTMKPSLKEEEVFALAQDLLAKKKK